MGIGNRVVSFFRLEDEDPDFVEGIRDGPPPMPPQEWDGGEETGKSNVRGVSGSARGGENARLDGQNGPDRAERGAYGHRGFLSGRWRKTVPKDEIDAMWWAKAARNAPKRDFYLLRLTIFVSGAVAFLLMVFHLRPWKELLTGGLLLLALWLTMDPTRTLWRRLAVQSRILLGAVPCLAALLLWRFSTGLLMTVLAYAALAALLVRAGNTEWLVAAVYCSSAVIYDAMKRDVEGGAMRSWDAGGARVAMTFCSEYGTFITSPYLYRMAQGLYILAWLNGKDRGAELEREEAEAKKPRRWVAASGIVGAGANQDDYDELLRRMRREVAEREERIAGMREEMEELRGAREIAKASARKAAKELEEAKKTMERMEAEVERQAAEMEAELSRRREEIGAEGAETKRLARIGRCRLEWDKGNASARGISGATGIPKSTVADIIRPWQAEKKAMESEAKEDESEESEKTNGNE